MIKTFIIPAAVLLASTAAQATPYAFASNQITGLTITAATGSFSATAYNETISDSSAFQGYAPATSASGANSSASKLVITQAYSGPTGAAFTGYTPSGPGTFTGTRANAMIGAGSAAAGGVSVSNVAEGYGTTSFGTSSANDKATIGFIVTGTGTMVTLSFMDTYQLIASTALKLGETANASISDTFSVTDAAGNSIAQFQPAALNQTVGSTNGTPGNVNVGPVTQSFSFTTPILTNGAQYTLALTSNSAENISAAVPEPATLALLGSALFGFGALRRKSSK